ncbi:MAG: primosomal protein N' [Candidatus Zixiibacteriota bacterium]|nr:MAG: primosomal protein N' [candidate division Zixibacteria bacterium]
MRFMYAKVAFPLPYVEHFTYKVDPGMAESANPGMLILAPFRNQSAVGVILEISEKSDLPDKEFREISGFGDPNLTIASDVTALVRLAAKRYGTTPGIVLKTALPPGSLQMRKAYFYPGPVESEKELSAKEREFLDFVKSNQGKVSYGDLRSFDGINRPAVDGMVRKGVLSLSRFTFSKRSLMKGKEKWVKAAEVKTTDFTGLSGKSKKLLEFLAGREGGIKFSELKSSGFSPSSANTLYRKKLIDFEFKDRDLPAAGGLDSLVEEKVVELTLWQRSALEKIETALRANIYSGFLLYGVTSSGKTQVYLEAAQSALSRGRSVLVLVPEISLTPQIVERFERFLKLKPLVWHSGLTPSEKYLIYRTARTGKSRLLIGARSAVFSPLRDLGLIVVDEEQDNSYKQDDPAPRYNARDLALERGKINNAVVILGSATPSCESYFAAREGVLELLTLPQRITGGPKPEVRVISTRIDSEKGQTSVFPKGFWPISVPLYEELSIRLKHREQVILLLNRRGYSSAVICFECGWVGKCPDCDIGWTYHKTGNKLVCHFCGKEKRGLTVCGHCESTRLSYRGAGTQRLEETLNNLFPKIRMERLDSDVASKRRQSQNVLESFGRGDFQVLLGTQMVAKGHHFPGVGLSAVIGADIGISLPDFRASEKVLQLLIQAAGRAGRSAIKKDPGLVMAQTFSPDNPIFEYLKDEDYTGFLESELKIREELAYPPFNRIVLVIVSSKDKMKAKNGASGLKNQMAEIIAEKEIRALGPAEAPIFRRGNMYRYQLLLKTDILMEPGIVLKSINRFAKETKGITVTIDVDPMNFL